MLFAYIFFYSFFNEQFIILKIVSAINFPMLNQIIILYFKYYQLLNTSVKHNDNKQGLNVPLFLYIQTL